MLNVCREFCSLQTFRGLLLVCREYDSNSTSTKHVTLSAHSTAIILCSFLTFILDSCHHYLDFGGFKRTAEEGQETVEVPIPIALNSDVALECDVLGASPPPQIKWYNDQGVITEVEAGNGVRFLDEGRYLYMRNLQQPNLERQYHCAVTNAHLNQEITAPTRYILNDNLTMGELRDYKQIGNLTAFVGNTSFEFSYVGGVFGGQNGTTNTLSVDGVDVSVLGNIGEIMEVTSPGVFQLQVQVSFSGGTETRRGTLTAHREFIGFPSQAHYPLHSSTHAHTHILRTHTHTHTYTHTH